jgi:excisionase family DNA binding protein
MEQVSIDRPEPDDRLAYSIPDVCRLLGISQATLHRTLARGDLRSVRMVGRTLILRNDLAQFLEGLPPRQPQRCPND